MKNVRPRRLGSWCALLMLLSAGAAGAQEAPESNAVRASTARAHHGFYLRFASGFSAYDERLRSNDSALGNISGRNRGLAAAGEIAIGGSVAPGWVIGGAIYTSDLLASTYRSTKPAPPAELDPGLRNLGLIAPFMDYAFESVDGLHLQAALGLATLTPSVFGDSATMQSKYLAAGAGLMFGGGYEWELSQSWRMGVELRTTLSVLGGRDDARAHWLHVVTTSPALLISLTYQ